MLAWGAEPRVGLGSGGRVRAVPPIRVRVRVRAIPPPDASQT